MSVSNEAYQITKDKLTATQEALARADRIIGWMADHIGGMAPPDGGLTDLNEHWLFMEKNGGCAPAPASRGGRPINQLLPR